MSISKHVNNNQGKVKDSNKRFNPYSGGRHLNAIRYSDLPPIQRQILHEISSQLDFRKKFYEQNIVMSKPDIAKYTGLSVKSVTRHLLKLESDRYVIQEVVGRNITQISMTKKLFDEYSVKISKDSESTLLEDSESNKADVTEDSESKVDRKSSEDNLSRDSESLVQNEQGLRVPGVGTESPGCRDRESLLYSPSSSPSSSPLYLRPVMSGMAVQNVLAKIRRGDKITFKELKGRDMSISSHPFMKVLKEGKKQRESIQPPKTEPPPPTTTSFSETSNELFNKFKSYFSGGFGRYDYKAQRALWDKAIERGCVEELKYVVDFYHGPEKPAACQLAAQKRMDDVEYTNHLFNEAEAIKRGREKDEIEKAKMKAEKEELARLEADPVWLAEQEARRKSRLKKLLEIKEKMRSF